MLAMFFLQWVSVFFPSFCCVAFAVAYTYRPQRFFPLASRYIFFSFRASMNHRVAPCIASIPFWFMFIQWYICVCMDIRYSISILNFSLHECTTNLVLHIRSHAHMFGVYNRCIIMWKPGPINVSLTFSSKQMSEKNAKLCARYAQLDDVQWILHLFL